MKHNKLLATLGLTLLLGLTACGTPDSSSAAKPTSTPKATTTAKPTTSAGPVEPEKEVEVESVDFKVIDNKVNLQVVGTCAGFKAADFKWALALQSKGESGEYLVGGDEFAAADYKYVGTITGDAFTVNFNLQDIQAPEGMEKAAQYTIKLGVLGYEDEIDVGANSDASRVKDSNYAYYIRNDQGVGSANSVIIDDLPLISLQEAEIINTDKKVIVKFGGDFKAGLTTEQYVYFDLQCINAYSLNQPSSKEITISGTKAYINADITSILKAGNRYSTHLSFTDLGWAQKPNCTMEVSFDKTYVVEVEQQVTIPAEEEVGESTVETRTVKLAVRLYSNPTAGAADGSEFYATLGFEVSEAEEGAQLGLQTK